jgi:flagellin-specific chaperone FliS
MNEHQKDIWQNIGMLMETSFKFNSPIAQLHLIREKINARGYKPFDKADIIGELGRMQQLAGELHQRMLKIYDLIK